MRRRGHGGSRAAGAVGGALPDKIGNAAVLFVKPEGTAKFVESKDWGTGRGAVVQDVDASVVTLFDDVAPNPEGEEAASPVG